MSAAALAAPGGINAPAPLECGGVCHQRKGRMVGELGPITASNTSKYGFNERRVSLRFALFGRRE